MRAVAVKTPHECGSSDPGALNSGLPVFFRQSERLRVKGMQISQINGSLIPCRSEAFLVDSEPDAVPNTQHLIRSDQSLRCQGIQQPRIDEHQSEDRFDSGCVRVGLHGTSFIAGGQAEHSA